MLLKQKFQRLWHNCSGAAALEYGLIAALIFLAIVAAVQGMSDSATSLFKQTDKAVEAMKNAGKN